MALNKITYDTKVALSPQPSVAAANKVTDSDMNSIKSVVNDAIDQIETNQSAITNLGNYSTSETDTGKKWTDGKTIYRKVLTANNLGNNASVQIQHGITNLGTLVAANLVWYDTGDNRWYFNFRFDSASIMVRFGGISSTIAYITSIGTDWSTRTSNVKLILEYTKTS